METLDQAGQAPVGELVRHLRAQQAAERKLFDSGPVVVLVWLPEDGWPLAYASANVEAQLGYTAREMLVPGFRYADLVHPDDLVRVGREVGERVAAGLSEYEQSYRLRGKDGRWRWFYDFSRPEWDRDGRLVRIRGYLIDRTRHKEAENALQESERRLRLAQAASGAGIWEWQFAGDRVLWDARCWQMLGYEDQAFAMDYSRWKTLVHPDDSPAALETLREQLARAQAFVIELRLRRADGAWQWTEVRGKAVEAGPDGRMRRVLGTHIDISARKASEEKIERMAFYDTLTGLPNRRLLLDRIGQAIAAARRAGSQGALVFVDLDRFKQLNDTLGHEMGDAMLVEVARRLQGAVRASDTVARLGGDEFVVMLTGLSGQARAAALQAETVVQGMLAELGQPVQLGGHQRYTGASFGVALFDGTLADADTLIRRADMAMYHAKRAGRHTLRFFDEAMQEAFSARVQGGQALRQALAEGGVKLHFERQYGRARQVVGAEALLRWPRRDGRVLRAREVLALAAEAGLSVQLGRYLLDAACAALARWRSDGEHGHWHLALNVDAVQLYHPDFPRELALSLERYALAPERLTLEVPEAALAGREEEAQGRLAALAGVGVRLSLDNFSLAFATIAQLGSLPLSELKVDCRQLWALQGEAGARALASAVLALCATLGVVVVARNVDTAAQYALCEELGFHACQGRYFGDAEAL